MFLQEGERSRSYREIPWNFMTHGFLDPSAFPELWATSKLRKSLLSHFATQTKGRRRYTPPPLSRSRVHVATTPSRLFPQFRLSHTRQPTSRRFSEGPLGGRFSSQRLLVLLLLILVAPSSFSKFRHCKESRTLRQNAGSSRNKIGHLQAISTTCACLDKI